MTRTFLKVCFLILPLAWVTPAAGQSFRSLVRKANQQYELKAYNSAIETYLEALDKRRDNAEALSKIADCFRHLNQMEEAAEYYAQAARERGMEPQYLLQFAQTLKALERYEEARTYFQQYASTDPRVAEHFVQTCEFARLQQSVTSDMSIYNERTNTPAADFGPVFYGNQIVLASSRTDVQRSTYNWDGQAKSQLFVSQPGMDGYLQPPVFLKGAANDRGEGPASFSADGRYVAYTRNNFVSGVRQLSTSGMEMSIFLAEVSPDGLWSNERPFPYNTEQGTTGYPSFTPDGNALFFASNRSGGYGGYDLYISYREGNGWTAPINLGPVVNTPGDELSPFFDGTDLYFASDWHAGFGGYDVFKAIQSAGRWSNVTNAGKPVNSSYDDFGYVFDSFRGVGYLASNRPGGLGAEDIYRVAKASDNMVLRVVNASDGSPIPNALIDLASCLTGGFGTDQVFTDGRGIYSFPVPSGIDCEITVSREGYNPINYRLSSFTLQGSRDVEIPLSRTSEAYSGKVVSYTTRLPLEGIVVTARNLNTGSSTRVYTDRNGNFSLALRENTAYVINYSGTGYREVNRNLNVLTGMDRDLLGTVTLYGSDVVAPPVTDPDDTGEPALSSGFAVQVAALGKEPDLASFGNLERFGTVYVKAEGGVYKIRVGVFREKSEAQRLIGGIRGQGYQGAFVVTESGAGVGPAGPSLPPDNPQPPVVGSGQYMIQLAAYSNPRWFDPSRINHLGTIVDRPKGNLTLKLLSGFSSLTTARTALREVQGKGFPGAFIVREVNGQLEKVN